MSPWTQLVVGCLMLSASLTYAAWSRFRVRFLRLDLAAIRERYRRGSLAGVAVDLDDSVRFVTAVDRLIRSVPDLSPAVVGPNLKRNGGELAGLLGPDAEPFLDLYMNHDRSNPRLDAACTEVGFRLGRYLFFETLSGWLALLRLIVFGIGEPARPETTRTGESTDQMPVRVVASLLAPRYPRRTA